MIFLRVIYITAKCVGCMFYSEWLKAMIYSIIGDFKLWSIPVIKTGVQKQPYTVNQGEEQPSSGSIIVWMGLKSFLKFTKNLNWEWKHVQPTI